MRLSKLRVASAYFLKLAVPLGGVAATFWATAAHALIINY